ncbi:hypothetical protein, partial [Microcoleus sp. S36b_A2]|uniref:hypothetical protein n=1 Tax=Microcoleus sp. S36b_A2 TaxID=3055418 RepID=UPI002FD76A20
LALNSRSRDRITAPCNLSALIQQALYSAIVPEERSTSLAGTLPLSRIKIYNSDAIGNDIRNHIAVI